MFKKILLLIVIFSPLVYSLLIGYPVISDQQFHLKERTKPEVSLSKRCFDVGNFEQFTRCFQISEKIKGIQLISHVSGKINQISPIFSFLFIVSLIVFVVTGISAMDKKNHKD